MIIAKNQKVRIIQWHRSLGATVSKYWTGKDAILKKWEHDDWYTVECEGKSLLLNSHEFIIMGE